MEGIIADLKSRDLSNNFYQNYPKLFESYFIFSDNDIVNRLGDIGYVYYQTILMIDSVLDDGEVNYLSKILLFHEETTKQLTSIFGLDEKFWKHIWTRRKVEYFQAVEIEKKLNGRDISWEQYMDLADKKSALGKIAIDCLNFFNINSENIETYTTLLESHFYFSVGFQLYDDLKDFKEDIEKGQFNWAVKLTQSKLHNDASVVDPGMLQKCFYVGGIFEQIFLKSKNYFSKAKQVLKPLKTDSEWSNVIDSMISTLTDYFELTNGYILTVRKRVELKNVKNDNTFFNFVNIDDTLSKGLNFIKSDYNSSYAELKHIMYLGNVEGFSNQSNLHISDTFQRAMLNCYLYDIGRENRLKMDTYILNEINYLLERRETDLPGGWSYFPTVQEIAPDIDDLGQIIQLFLKTGRVDTVIKYCSLPIKYALENEINIDGGIGTWIIPNNERTRIHQQQDIFNRTKWGTGPDLEVVANFIYALQILDNDKYKIEINKAINYIVNNQSVTGLWNSRWYYGTMYGTYVALRVLKTAGWGSDHPIIQKAIQKIKSLQATTGGFGLDQTSVSDPISTAFALMAFKFYPEECENQILLSRDFLFKSQQIDGSWKETNFIKPKAQEPYKSKVLTTSVVLGALFS